MPRPHELALPRHWTPRTDRFSDANAGRVVSQMLGRPWLPYQQFIAEVAGEKLDAYRYAHHTIVVWMPRQTAKTTTAYDSMLGRGRIYPGFRSRYTTHQGTITSAKFGEWFTEIEQRPNVQAQMKLRRSQGTEGVRWLSTASYFQAFPPRDGALRSQALDGVVVDEAQEHDDILGAALRSTIRPTFTTRPRRQLWIVFSAGTDTSTYALSYLAKAMAGAPGYALFDYGCPDDVDPLDESLWPTWHPGLAYGLTSVEAMRAALEEDDQAFIREYANRWTHTTYRVVDPRTWAAALLPPEAPRPEGRMCLGVDVAADRGSAAIAVAVQAASGPYIEVVDAHAGTEWGTGRALELQATHGAPIVIDKYGAVGTVADALDLAGANLIGMKTQDVANAAAGLLDDLETGHLAVYPSPALTEAVDGVATRPLGDGNGFAFSRKASSAPIAPLVAVAAARWGLARLPNPVRPQVHAG